MKKTLFFAAMSGLALVGCVENEPVTKGDGAPVPITFDQPVVSVPTRATEIYGNYPKDNTFAVYALYHEANYSEAAWGTTNGGSTTDPVMYMNNVTCAAHISSDKAEYWKPTTTYYWPKNGMLTFGAYAPVMAETTTGGSGKAADGATGSTVYSDGTVKWTKTGFQFTGFKVKASPAEQIDLLYCDPQTNKTHNSEVTDQPYDGITIPFKHALSSILFTAKTAGDYNSGISEDSKKTVITLTGITVKNVYAKGDFDQKVAITTSGDGGSSTASGTPEWTNLSESTTYTVPIKNTSSVTGITGLVLTNTENYVNGEIDKDNNNSLDTYPGNDQNPPATPNGGNVDSNSSSGTVQNDGKRRSDLIVIPQDLTRTENSAETHVTVEITYTIKTGSDKALPQKAVLNMTIKKQGTNNGDGGTTGGSTGGSTGGASDGSTDKDAWEMGKRYIYNIEIGLHEIRLNPQVYNWKDVTGDYQKVEI